MLTDLLHIVSRGALDGGLAGGHSAPASVPAYRFSLAIPSPCLEAESPCKRIPAVRLAFLEPLFVIFALSAALRCLGHQSAVFSLPPLALQVQPDLLQRAHWLFMSQKRGAGEFPHVAGLKRVIWVFLVVHSRGVDAKGLRPASHFSAASHSGMVIRQ